MNLKKIYQGQNNAILPIRLVDLLFGLGSVQPRRVNSSLLSSLIDYGYLLERIANTNELKIKISETREKFGSEMLTEVSELMGMGLSVAIIDQLFDIQSSTISKIIGTSSRRPDWRCLLKDGRTMLVEAKGTTNKNNSTQQLKEAIEQKNTMTGDVKVAAATVLNEHEITNMKIVDPPIISDGELNGKLRHVYRANHYASVFSFLGEDVLSLYFEKMAKRLSGLIGEREMYDKEFMFNELNYQAPSIRIKGINFVGHLYGPIAEQYLFLGVDKRLLSYKEFILYKDHNEIITIENKGNDYSIYSDGIIVANIKNHNAFFEENKIDSTQIGYDRIALNDIDSIRGRSFKRYVKYLLDKSYGNTEWEDNGSLKVEISGVRRLFYCYHVRNFRNIEPSFHTLKRIMQFMNGKKGVLVTNLSIPGNMGSFSIVDRKDFERIAESCAANDVIENIFGRD